jgi:hypothetical protein
VSHHYSGPDFGFPHGDARLDFTEMWVLLILQIALSAKRAEATAVCARSYPNAARRRRSSVRTASVGAEASARSRSC